MHLPKIFIFIYICSFFTVYAQHKGKYDISVSSAAIQNLYRNCANKIKVDVPDLCNEYNPICSATEADIQQSTENKRKFLLIPTGKTCTLSVSNHTGESIKPLGELLFNVIDPPKPTIEIRANGQRIGSDRYLERGSNLTIRVVPDPTFAALMPNDAKYRVETVRLFLGYHGYPKLAEWNFLQIDATQEIKIPIPNDVFQRGCGMRIYIEISDIYRVNYKGEKIVDSRLTLYEKGDCFSIK